MDIVQAEKIFVQRMQSRNLSKRTIDNYASQIRCFLREFKDRDRARNITADEIEKYLLLKTMVNSRKHSRCAIQSFYDLVIGQPMKLNHIPWPKKDKKLPIVLSQDEIQRMFDVCENLKHKTILAVLYSAGLRVSELINLQWRHLDRSRGVINIIGAKGNKDRQVPLPESLIIVLEKYWLAYKTKNYIFSGQFGEQYSDRSVGEVVKQLASKAGINKRVWTHLLRHCSFTHMVEGGTDIPLISRIAGHSHVKTTNIYLHLSHNLISKIVSPLSKIQL